jgi:hypothetical protein
LSAEIGFINIEYDLDGPMTDSIAKSVSPSLAEITGASADQAKDLLFSLLLEVARRHQPEIESVLLGQVPI